MTSSEKRHPDPRRAETRRKQVLEAAAVCFSRSGFHGASMAEISKAAGMSAGHIYNYFDGKDAIIAAFVEAEVERVSELMRDLGQRADPLQSMLDDSDDSVDEHLAPSYWTPLLEVFAESSRNPKIAAALRDADRRSRSQFRAIFKAGREHHQLPADEALLNGRMEAIIALFHGLSIRMLHHPELDRQGLYQAFRLTLATLLFK